MIEVKIDGELRISPDAHQIFLIFDYDYAAELFGEWWFMMGEDMFQKWSKEKDPEFYEMN